MSNPRRIKLSLLAVALLLSLVPVILWRSAEIADEPNPLEIATYIESNLADSHWQIVESYTGALDYRDVSFLRRFRHWMKTNFNHHSTLRLGFSSRSDNYQMSNRKIKILISVEILDNAVQAVAITASKSELHIANQWKNSLSYEWPDTPILIRQSN
jgi:hypothetical protein